MINGILVFWFLLLEYLLLKTINNHGHGEDAEPEWASWLPCVKDEKVMGDVI